MKKLILSTAVFILQICLYGQVGIGTDTPSPSAILDMDVSSYPENDKKGFLLPRMTADQRLKIPSPATGLLIYNTTEKCLNFFNGTGWISTCDGSITYPPVPLNTRLGGSGSEQAYYSSIKQTADGGFFIAGRSGSSTSGDVSGANHGSNDYWILKLDAAGNKTWDKLLGGSGEDRGVSAQQTTDGGYVIAGHSQSSNSGDVSGTNHGSYDYWVVKLDAAGNKTWDKLLGGTADDRAYAVRQTTDGGYIVAGYSLSSNSGDVSGTNHGSYDYWVVKLDAAGNKIWDKLLGGTADDVAYAVRQTTDGGYIVAGYSLSSNSGDVSGTNHGSNDYWVVKLDASGNKIWDKLLGGSGVDIAWCVRQNSDDGYIVAGYSEAGSAGNGNQAGLTGRGNEDIWIIRIDENGDIVQ